MKPHLRAAIIALALATPVVTLGVSNAQSEAPTKCSVGAAINANTASDAKLLRLPGVGKSVLAEIKEYRPYRNMAHFKKEIGKYVKGPTFKKLVACIYVK